MPDLKSAPYLVHESEFDSLNETLSLLPPPDCINNNNNNNDYCSSNSSPSSFTNQKTQTQRPSLIQRSASSHSLLHNKWTHPLLSSVASEFFDSEIGPFRRVYSAGDLQMVNMRQQSYKSSESPLSNESNAIIEGMRKACPYSPEEKKERIERYKSKRNLRNFNKKIKYACRKTLADSRPRIRRRFARNDEIEKSSQIQWSDIIGDQDVDDEDDNYWVNILDASLQI